jgi:hypothetical protein
MGLPNQKGTAGNASRRLLLSNIGDILKPLMPPEEED